MIGWWLMVIFALFLVGGTCFFPNSYLSSWWVLLLTTSTMRVEGFAALVLLSKTLLAKDSLWQVCCHFHTLCIFKIMIVPVTTKAPHWLVYTNHSLTQNHLTLATEFFVYIQTGYSCSCLPSTATLCFIFLYRDFDWWVLLRLYTLNY